VPAGLAAKDAAAIICAGITTYKGIKETEAKAGEWVLRRDLVDPSERISAHAG
jgi:D-arabinose 1-dehydrogenase-like Zn-dependent alcohol dehydrogenase